MADTAYDSDRIRKTIATKGAKAVIPNNPSRALKYPLGKQLYARRINQIAFSAAASPESGARKDRPFAELPN